MIKFDHKFKQKFLNQSLSITTKKDLIISNYIVILVKIMSDKSNVCKGDQIFFEIEMFTKKVH